MIPIVPVTASYSDHEEAADGTIPQECLSHQGYEQDTEARLWMAGLETDFNHVPVVSLIMPGREVPRALDTGSGSVLVGEYRQARSVMGQSHQELHSNWCPGLS